MKHNRLTQSFAILLTAALAGPSFAEIGGGLSPAVEGPAFARLLAPSAKLGYVSSSFSTDPSAKQPRLVVLSDLHGHVEVQRHIMGILDETVNKLTAAGQQMAGKQVPILMEGAWTSGLEEPLKSLTDSNTRAFFKEYFLQKSEMGAAQAYSEQIAGSGKVKLIGVENEEEYKANKAQFARTYPARKALLEALHREEIALKRLSSAISNSSFESLQQIRDGYYAGRVAPERFARALARQARRFHIENQYVSLLRSAATANPDELEGALTQVYRQVAVRAAEKKPLTAFLRRELDNEKDLRAQIAHVDAQLDLLKRLVGNQLTPAEVPLAMDRMPDLVRIAQALTEKDNLTMDVGQVVRESVDFYPFAMLRDESLVKNSIAALDKMGPGVTGILVVGGFHSQAIAGYLREHHISYLEISPAISRDLTSEEQLNYVKRVCDDHVTPAEVTADIQWLRNGGRGRLAASAIGPATTLNQGETGGNLPKMAGVLTAAQLDAVSRDGRVLANLMQKMTPEFAEAVASKDADAVKADRAAVVKSVIDSRLAQNPELKSIPSESVADGLSFSRSGDNWNHVGHEQDSVYAGAMNELFGALTPEQKGRVQDWNRLDVVFVPEAKLKEMGLQATVLSDKDRAVLILPEDRRTAIAAISQIQEGKLNGRELSLKERRAVMLGIHDFAHELFGHHILGANAQQEGTALAGGILLAARIAANHFATSDARDSVQQVVQQMLEAITPQVDVDGGILQGWKQKIQDRRLAEAIAQFIEPPQLGEVEVQKMVNELHSLFPQVSPEEFEKVLNQERTSFMGRMNGGNIGGPGLRGRLIAIGRRLTFRNAADAAKDGAA